jgi:hypothetical protein
MRGLAALLLALVAGWAALPVGAQERTAEPSDAQRCLRHEQGAQAQPVYPPAAYNANQGGQVQIELEFKGPERAPATRVLLHAGGDELLQAVEAHVKGLRVPCMSGERPVVLRQDYVFQPDRRRVHWSRASDPRAEARERQWACLAHTSGFVRGLEYPWWARRDEVQGRVVVRMRFDAPDAPPRLEVFSRDSASRLADEVRSWAEGYRLPCLEGGPLATTFTYVFYMKGESFGFRDVGFAQFVGSMRGVREQTVSLDTNEMACPFDLRIQYRQPALPNAVGEVGTPVPARRPLLEWLAAAELDLSRRSLDSVWGDTAKVTVPCIKINLKPKEKT